MRKKSYFVAILMVLCGVLCAQEYVTSIPGGQVSATREQIALNLALDYFRKNGTENSDTAIAGLLCGPFLMMNPGLVQEPKAEAKGVVECENAAAVALQKALDKSFPKRSEEELAQLAAEKYPLYKIGDRVRVNFSTNSQTSKTVDGVYYGTANGMVKVSKFRIRLDDMANVEGNESELLKFSPDATENLRKEYIRKLEYENARKREEFNDEKRDEIVKLTVGSFSKSNEEAGYTWFEDTWLKPIDYMTAITGKARLLYAQELQEAKQKQIDSTLNTIQAQITSQEIRNAITPDNMRINPADVLKAQAEAQKQREDELAKKQQEAEERKREAEERASKAALGPGAVAAKGAAQGSQPGQAASSEGGSSEAGKGEEEETEKGESILSQLMLPIAGTILVLCLIGLLVAVATKIKRVKERDRFKKFFEGKGKLQQDFWDMAAADPENFKYVAYMFPTLKAATEALQRLSYIVSNPNGDLRCTRDNLLFGVYPHQDQAVAFIGGADFRYAAWREATAVLPELEGAQYFKVSTEPSVMLEIPDIEKMASEQNINIENLGIEELRDENGKFSRCYKYKTESKEMAMLFLENFQINEEGIVVQVETPEGIFGKDENGIYAA